MEVELPTEFDLIVVGTGVVESIISAAASRIGKRVLHLDSKNFYGGQWASFNLDLMQKLDITEKRQEFFPGPRENGEIVVSLGNDILGIKDFSVQWHIPEKEIIPEKSEVSENVENHTDGEQKDIEKVEEEILKPETWTQERLLKDSRKFNIDLTPKLQFARGDFVELLISSNIARYSEYRNVSRVLTWLNGQLEIVPCSRSDVFANNKVTVIEKRMLMKLFTSLDDDEKELIGEFDKKTFRAFLKEKKLTPNLIHYVLYAISMSTDETLCLQGIQNTKRFLNSLGRFGKTPFLFSMYGSGEITQGFCRLSAVFGGVYALNQSLNGLVFTAENHFKSLLCNTQEIVADHLVMGADKAPNEFLESSPQTYISRAVLLTDKSLMVSEKEHLTLLLYPPENGRNSCAIIELGALTGTCLKQLFLVHLISKQLKNPKEDFRHCIENLFSGSDEKPNILWSCFFSIPDVNDLDLRSKSPSNVYICPGPDLDLDYDFSIKKAKDIFSTIYPDADFLPRAPDPEEIIIEGDSTETENSENVEMQILTKDSENLEISNENIRDQEIIEAESCNAQEDENNK